MGQPLAEYAESNVRIDETNQNTSRLTNHQADNIQKDGDEVEENLNEVNSLEEIEETKAP